MGLAVKIVDETPVGRQQSSFVLHLASERVTARELIKRRIRQEVEHYNRDRGAEYRGLVQPTGAEQTLNGYRLGKPRELDWQQQFAKAERAFQENGFVLLVDDAQVAGLDKNITLGAESVVTFLRLVPLVGG